MENLGSFIKLSENETFMLFVESFIFLVTTQVDNTTVRFELLEVFATFTKMELT